MDRASARRRAQREQRATEDERLVDVDQSERVEAAQAEALVETEGV
jgi:hypothetical protein